MNRSVVIGGVVAVAVLLGLAAWLLLRGGLSTSTSQQLAAENQGPIALNLVTVVTDHAANQSEDGRTLKVTFPTFDLSAKSGETVSAVFSTTWHLKMGPDERALVAAGTVNGYMKSAAAPAPTTPAPAAPAAPEPTTATTPAPAGTPASGAATVAEQPAQPVAPSPAKPVAGDGLARVVLTIGAETFVTDWMDLSGAGADHKISKAAAFTGSPVEFRNGSTLPVTVTVELSGGHAGDASAKINDLELQLFAENAPIAPPPAADASTTAPATPAAPADGTTTPPATPPADSTTTPPPANSGSTPP